MNVGIMGGTFDPIHMGHLIMAEQAREQAGLDEVWFMPSNEPPHKSSETVSSAGERLEMVRLAVEGQPGFRLCGLEIERGGISYTIETATELRSLHPDCRFSWIIGADMIAYLPKWYKIDELLSIIRFIGLNRSGFKSAASGLPEVIRSAVRMVDAPHIDISSTVIRSRIREGRSVRYLLPDPVENYIREKGLYGA